MLPTYHQLKLQLWWILSDPGESHDRYLEQYRAFFSEHAPLLDVDATFSFGEPPRGLSVGHSPPGPEVSLLSFSFGTLAELGTYVQHHQVSAYLYCGHRDYWVDSTFQHDQRRLHIYLHLNHRSGCEDRVAEYRFVVPYLNILKVHFENRILRKFNSEFAIHVSFRDDNLDKLSFTLNLHSSRDAVVDAVVGSFLHQGVRVGTREFKFLAPSMSQLRDHGYRGRRAVCAC
ncbi:uncharacterized protein LOC125942825 [Dermacentor silvarum]|uniref:uncharacterized protein LOC125942825 n=1 Tax=Dermacentor silvarum TaxID=543639 RepID=UPI002100E2FB|nr:uncharacterized protein LOC125942825 [Dermacentor silvarum]